MRCRLGFILSIIVLTVPGCHTQTNPPTSSDSSRLYQYTAFDSTAAIVVTGTMHFTRLDSVISGERNLIGSGSEAGSGSISGSVTSYGTITILFPSQQVGAVYIVGRQANSTITGDRYLDTGARIRGIKVGTFQLIAANH